MQYSWVDVNFIIECCDIWAFRHAKARDFKLFNLWRNPDLESADESDDDGNGNGSLPSLKRYFTQDYEAFCQEASGKWLFRGDEALQSDVYARWAWLHRNTRIPDGLITGPWDEGAQMKLFWLLRGGARLESDQTWEITLEGYRNAVADESSFAGPNLPLLRMLNMLGAFGSWPEYVARAEAEKLEGLSVVDENGDSSRKTISRYYIIAQMLHFVHPGLTSE